jgi:hypothetical protein
LKSLFSFFIFFRGVFLGKMRTRSFHMCFSHCEGQEYWRSRPPPVEAVADLQRAALALRRLRVGSADSQPLKSE